MKKNKTMMYALALTLAGLSLTGCNNTNTDETVGESKPAIVVENKNLGQVEEQIDGVIDGVTYFPQTKQVYGSDYSIVMFNAQLLDFDKEDFKTSDILKALSADIDTNSYEDKSCSDFTFKGFKISRGSHTLGYIELFENGKVLEQKDFDINKLDEYEFKGLFTEYIGNPDSDAQEEKTEANSELSPTMEVDPNAEVVNAENNTVTENTTQPAPTVQEPSTYSRLLTFGNSIFCGNRKSGKGIDEQGTGVTDVMGDGYSNRTKTMTYYADANGFTIGVVYKDGIVIQVYFLKN